MKYILLVLLSLLIIGCSEPSSGFVCLKACAGARVNSADMIDHPTRERYAYVCTCTDASGSKILFIDVVDQYTQSFSIKAKKDIEDVE